MTARQTDTEARTRMLGAACAVSGTALVLGLAVSGSVPVPLAFLGLMGLLLPGLRGRQPVREPVPIPVRSRR
ncbi:hypothetical protein [Mangrovicoccus sp. HB161399]|uniref:hypothetical protein n=1 Tax=Mangrovicoccus sp. HB161399 TaxID=2720392 RepID=UPI001554F3ED|nr:hypothetical protein [Mangrovicoccus sp. HB161399]